MTTREERIESGVKFMDELRGTDWVNDIELETLDLGHPHHCVVGQLEGAFYEAAPRLFPDSEEGPDFYGAEFGFNVTRRDAKNGSVMVKYDRLTAAWKTRIRKLRKERRGD